MTDIYLESDLSPQDLGYFGEILAAGMLALRGIPVRPGGAADLLIYENVPIEIKTATERAINDHVTGFQFCISRQGRSELRAPFAILICYQDPPIRCPIFIIPDSEIGTRKTIAIPSPVDSYNGRWKKWRNP